MRLLLVAATELELAPLVHRLTPGSHSFGPLRPYTHGSHLVDVLTTGVGMVATAAWCARVLARESYDLAINLGVCGSFDPAYPPGRLVNPEAPANRVIAELRAVNGITVNTVHGHEPSIARVVERFDHPVVETMEGAAFMYACLVSGVRFAQVRAVSNMVEKRNRAAWKLTEAVAALNDVALRLVEQP
jgi:futalosine hydrolase